jgi:iron(III) transport system ATP-binding protein
MTQQPLLRLEQVTKQFSHAEIPAVNQVSLTLMPGEILGLLGPSGCGKTTLLRLIAGFEQPQTGRIELAKPSMQSTPSGVIATAHICVAPERRSIGMVFQDFALFPHLTVAENVAFGLKSKSKRRLLRESLACRSRVAEAIALVGLEGKENCYPHELSGGQQQRVALARALAPRPSLILLDEPLSNLDVQVRLYLRQEVRDILKDTGTSAIFVTHDQEEAMAISDRIGVMHQGRLEQVGTPEQIYREPASRFIAEFVTQANFIPARRQGQVWHTEIGCFVAGGSAYTCQCQNLTAEHQAIDLESGDLMIRQEDLQLAVDETGSVVVHDRQFLGREYRYCLRTATGRELHARTSTATVIPTHARVRLSIAGQAFQFFAKSERSTAMV